MSHQNKPQQNAGDNLGTHQNAGNNFGKQQECSGYSNIDQNNQLSTDLSFIISFIFIETEPGNTKNYQLQAYYC